MARYRLSRPWVPAGSFSVIASPRGVVDPDAADLAEPHVHLAGLRLVLDIAHDAVRTWNQLRGISPEAGGDALHREAAHTFWDHRVLPTQVRERLTTRAIRWT